MYKLNLEIYPFSTKGMSPRKLISKNKFARIRNAKIEKLRCRCEACGRTENIELHESGKIKNRKYIFQGFILLCRKCHDVVHLLQLDSMYKLGPEKRHLSWLWKGNYKIKKYGSFKSKAEFDKYIYKSVDQAFDFMFAHSVSCDYSKAKKYGLDPKQLKNSFKEKYNHLECTRRYVMSHVYSCWKGEETEFKLADTSYDRYLNENKVKKYEAMIYAAYYKDETYYKNTIIAHRKAIDERLKVLGLV